MESCVNSIFHWTDAAGTAEIKDKDGMMDDLWADHLLFFLEKAEKDQICSVI